MAKTNVVQLSTLRLSCGGSYFMRAADFYVLVCGGRVWLWCGLGLRIRDVCKGVGDLSIHVTT